MTARRQFIQIVPAVALGALGVRAAHAQTKVDEKDPVAMSFNYVQDATKTDKAKNKTYAAGQACGNCALYLGKADPWGGCPLFPGKQVAAAGWCSAYNKKA